MAVLELERPLRVTEVTDRGAFEALAHEWDALVAATDDQIFYRHEFVRTWIAHFAPTAPLRVLLARDATGGLAAVLPLVEQRTSLLGAPLIELRSTANAHSCRFDLLAADADLAGRAFFAHLAEDQRWDVLRIGEVPEGGRAWTLAAAAAARGYPVASTSVDSPYVPLRPSWPEQSATLPAKFRANCRRRRRKLEATGAVTFDPCPGGDELDAYLEAGFELEARGWKGSRGTAMAQSQSTRGFYTELARAAWRGKYLRLYFLSPAQASLRRVPRGLQPRAAARGGRPEGLHRPWSARIRLPGRRHAVEARLDGSCPATLRAVDLPQQRRRPGAGRRPVQVDAGRAATRAAVENRSPVM